jgi:LPXTG-motif cell wall-anchored protein
MRRKAILLMASGLRVRWLALPLTLLAVAATVGLAAQPAAAAPLPVDRSTPGAAGWLARQLVDGERFDTVIPPDTFINPGLTIDGVLAFAAAGVSGDNAAKAVAWLNKPEVAANYDGDFNDDTTVGFGAGALAKLLLVAEVGGQDPTAFGGVDLIALLLPLQEKSGKFTDSSRFGDSSNTLGQSFATIALARTGDHDAAASSAGGFLAGLKCADGGYPLAEVPDPDKGCVSEVDATALVVQALLAVGLTDAAKSGLDYLVAQQKTDGGFPIGDVADGPENANSTGLAAQALRVGGRDAAADKAVAFIRTLQVGCDGVAADRGAIAFLATGFEASSAPRATTQALLGLGGIGLAKLSLKGAQGEAPTVDCPTPTATLGPVAGLPVTGASVTPILYGGAGLIVVGAFLLLAFRRRRGTVES